MPIRAVGADESGACGVGGPLLTTHYSPTTYHPLPTTHHLLPTTYYAPPTTHYPLPTTHYSLTTRTLGREGLQVPRDAAESRIRLAELLPLSAQPLARLGPFLLTKCMNAVHVHRLEDILGESLKGEPPQEDVLHLRRQRREIKERWCCADMSSDGQRTQVRQQ